MRTSGQIGGFRGSSPPQGTKFEVKKTGSLYALWGPLFLSRSAHLFSCLRAIHSKDAESMSALVCESWGYFITSGKTKYSREILWQMMHEHENRFARMEYLTSRFKSDASETVGKALDARCENAVKEIKSFMNHTDKEAVVNCLGYHIFLATYVKRLFSSFATGGRERPPRQRNEANREFKTGKLCRAFLATVAHEEKGVDICEGSKVSSYIRSTLDKSLKLRDRIVGRRVHLPDGHTASIARVKFCFNKIQPVPPTYILHKRQKNCISP